MLGCKGLPQVAQNRSIRKMKEKKTPYNIITDHSVDKNLLTLILGDKHGSNFAQKKILSLL